MRLPIALLSLALAGCGSTSSRSDKPLTGSAVVPVGESSVLVFSENGVERLDGSARSPVAADVPRTAPIAVANDPSSGWAAVAYAGTIAVVNTSEARVKPIEGVRWDSPPSALGIGGTTIGTIEDGTIALYDALEGKRLWKEDGRKLLRDLGLEELRYVMPLTRDRMLVVAFKSMAAMSEPQAMVVDIDRSAGAPVSQERPFGGELHWLEACAGDGQNLFVAGTNQAVENVGPRQQQMVKTILVLRHDPARGRNQVLVRARQEPSTEVRVVHLAAGFGLVAYTLDDGRVNVYDASGEREAAWLWGDPRPGLTSIECVDRDHVALVSGSRVEIQRVR